MRYIVCLYNYNNQSEPASRFGMFTATCPSLNLFFFVIINNDIRVISNAERRVRTGFPSNKVIII